jgi:hypothetical protein
VIIFIISIAFHGRLADLLTRLSGSAESYGANRWITWSADVDLAFFVVYLFGVLIMVAGTIKSHSVSRFRSSDVFRRAFLEHSTSRGSH